MPLSQKRSPAQAGLEVFQSLGSALRAFALGLPLVGLCEAGALDDGWRGVNGLPRHTEGAGDCCEKAHGEFRLVSLASENLI